MPREARKKLVGEQYLNKKAYLGLIDGNWAVDWRPHPMGLQDTEQKQLVNYEVECLYNSRMEIR